MTSLFKFFTSKGQLAAFALGLICSLIAVGSIVGGVNSNYSMSDDLNSIMKSNPEASFDFFNPAISVVIFLIIVALVLAVVFGLLGLFSDLKGSMKFLIGLGLVVALFFILYATAGVETTGRLGMLTEKFNVSDNVSRLITAGTKTAVYSIIVAAVAAAVMEIMNLFK